MQLIPEGPNIPEALLNAHADGKVVFFCGAGVSLDAGYPLFGGLVEQLEQRNPVTSIPEMKEAVDRGDYDFALSIIQKKLAKNAIKLRRDTAQILSSRPRTLKNHTAILRLSRLRDGTCRLITTNFDRLFIKAAKKLAPTNIDCAPRLPIPKADRWNSILHLHGLLPAKADDLELGNLVLTSADFGEAYLTDSYCSRFVVELLRNFTVVFIGYSLNDRIMRYLLDAISYSEKFFDETLKIGHFKKPYAFVEHNEEDKERVVGRWELKEVTPIPYFVEEGLRRNRGSHHRLYDTLNSWADLASGGQNARVTLALNEATKPFLPEDTFGQERLLWALRDEDGKAAEALATVETKEQTASVDWLPFFAKNGLLDQVYSPFELQLLSATQQRDTEKALSPRYLGSTTSGTGNVRLKPQTAHLVSWMQWHLDTLELPAWLLKNGGVPHPDFAWAYGHPHNKDKRSQLTNDQKRFWDILTSDAYARSHAPTNRWFDMRDNLNLEDRFDALEFMAHLRPKLDIRPSSYNAHEGKSESYFRHFEFDLRLSNDEMDYLLKQIVAEPERQKGLEFLCADISQLILQGMNLLALIGKTSSDRDLTSYSIPSISPHDQNEFVDGFGQLVFLLRVSFDRKLQFTPAVAIDLAKQWSFFDYPLFKRLLLYAAKQCGSSLDQTALHLLTEDNGRWLWALDTTREVHVYLRERVQHWTQQEIARLCRTILKGPDRSRYHEMSNKEWRNIRDRTIAHHLKKLEQGGVKMPNRAAESLASLKAKFPYELPDDRSDEFVIFSGPVRDAEWGEDLDMDAVAYQSFSGLSPTERVANWDPNQSSMLRKLALNRPDAALDTLEQGLAKRLDDANFWSEGISSLLQAIEDARLDAKETASDDR